MRKSFKYKLYHNKKLQTLHGIIDAHAEIWNYCIAINKRYYKLFKKSLNSYQLKVHITKLKKTKRYDHWKNLPSQSIQDVVERVDKAYALFFSKIKTGDKKARPPKFKPRKKYRSYTLKTAGYKLIDDDGYGKIKIGKLVFPFFKSRDIKGDIKTCTVKRNSKGHIFIILSSEGNFIETPLPKTGHAVGLDWGMKCFITTSDETHIQNPLFAYEAEKSIAELNQQLSVAKKGTIKRRNIIKKLVSMYEKVANQRRDFHFKLAKQLLETYDEIFIENLSMSELKEKPYFGKKVSDMAWDSFIQVLEWMATKYGKVVQKISKWFPSSKRCSHCGHIKQDLSLKDRVYNCEKCGFSLDRDVNTCYNILQEGKNVFNNKLVGASTSIISENPLL
jgi:putative transposase